MSEEFDLLAAALEVEEEWRNTAPPGLELAVIGSGDNRVYTYVEPELLDMAEFRRSMFSAALKEWERGMVIDRELQNSRARLFWRAQRRMSITELMDMLGVHYGTMLEALGQL